MRRVLAFINEQERSVGTYLYGRRMYELMTVWETDPAAAGPSVESGHFAELWQKADKIVYSATLTEVATQRTQLRRTFEAAEVERLKSAVSSDLNVAGPTLAAHAFQAGLVDEVQVIVAPVIVGAGLRCYPDTPTQLTLRDERRFGNGMVWLRYDVTRTRTGPPLGG
jgi:riboflavin biosynthesis pyrimidine reductase